jgi:hypothetical protein
MESLTNIQNERGITIKMSVFPRYFGGNTIKMSVLQQLFRSLTTLILRDLSKYIPVSDKGIGDVERTIASIYGKHYRWQRQNNKRRKKTMGMIKSEEIVAYWTGHQNSQIACTDCITHAELSDITEEQIITRDEIENDDAMFFCNSCDKRL